LKEDRDKFKKALGRRTTYCNELEKDLFENSSNYVIKKQKVKDKIEELEKEIVEKQENCCDFTLIHEHEIDTIAIIKVLQELLESEE
jgi:hypothetical protein